MRGVGLGTITLETVMMPDLGIGEGVVEGVEEVRDEDAKEVAEVVVDALSELDELAGEGVDVAEDV